MQTARRELNDDGGAKQQYVLRFCLANLNDLVTQQAHHVLKSTLRRIARQCHFSRSAL